MESLMKEMEKINKRNKSIIENANIKEPSYIELRNKVKKLESYINSIVIEILKKEDKYTPN